MDTPVDLSRTSFEWRLADIGKLLALLAVIYWIVLQVPNKLWDGDSLHLLGAIGVISAWRYGWWLTHFIRAQIFAHIVYPRKRRRADALWASGWRPQNLYFMMTTYKEDRLVTEKVITSILNEAASVGVPTRIFIGTGDQYDEDVISDVVARYHQHRVAADIVFIRQNKPGKRFAIGLALRAMCRHGVGGDDPVIFLDGDSIMAPGCVRKCLPFFALDPSLQALTTDEKVCVEKGPLWIKSWLRMRFAQRHLAMQSHALSNKVLTLTGRMSVFRAANVVKKEFIRTIESDHLEHWLWHQFRFLSGDDKSTWYCLLKSGGNMFYVPDALVITVERIEGNGRERMIQNLLRWSGNVLRNGARALALGPRHVGFFIWWCILDQRIAMWTTLIGPLSALILTLFVDPGVILVYLVWVLITRTFLSLMLYPYAGRILISFPLFLFLNQLVNSIVKVYLVFRLPRQRWMNRGNQRAQTDGSRMLALYRNTMASYLTAFWVSALAFALFLYLGVIEPLSLGAIRI